MTSPEQIERRNALNTGLNEVLGQAKQEKPGKTARNWVRFAKTTKCRARLPMRMAHAHGDSTSRRTLACEITAKTAGFNG
jgi:hypothetical protein